MISVECVHYSFFFCSQAYDENLRWCCAKQMRISISQSAACFEFSWVLHVWCVIWTEQWAANLTSLILDSSKITRRSGRRNSWENASTIGRTSSTTTSWTTRTRTQEQICRECSSSWRTTSSGNTLHVACQWGTSVGRICCMKSQRKTNEMERSEFQQS